MFNINLEKKRDAKLKLALNQNILKEPQHSVAFFLPLLIL